MFYAPHTLYRLSYTEERDEYNRTVSVGGEWECVGECRCDDNTTDRIQDVNGNWYVPRYKIVSTRHDISLGDRIKVLNGDNLRGEGKVRNISKNNYLDYMVIYV